MLDNEAGAGGGEDTAQGGSGAPSGGPPEGGSENDDKPITARQLKAALASQKRAFDEQIAAKDRELQAFKEGVGAREPALPKVFTRADLKAAVDAGQVTQAAADELWDQQERSRNDARAAEVARATVAGEMTKERIDQEIESYKRLKPEIMDHGSETREKIQAEFNYLVSVQGMKGQGPEALKTQHAAIRAVLGPLDKLENAAKARRAPEGEQQSGGGGGKPAGGQGNGKTPLVNKLSQRQREHYDKGIKSGRYKDWNEVEAELKFAPTRVGRP